MIHIFSLSTDSLWNKIDQELMAFIPFSRKKKIDKYYFDCDKKLSLYAALLIQMQANIFTKIPIEELNFSHTLYNKPILSNMPNFHFNISHTKDRILCAISSTPIGVDIELSANAPYEVMTLIFHPTEIKYVYSAHTEKEKKYRFFTIWTKKEALSKAWGFGLIKELATICTLDPGIHSNLYNWKEQDYICSIYSLHSCKKISHKYLYEKDIHQYYKEYYCERK